jgi:hypothetical protein
VTISPLPVLVELTRRAADHPSAFLAWQPLQLAFLADDSRMKLMRAGNQWAGKTEALCAEIRWAALGDHPFYDVREPPVSIYVISPTYKLSNKLQHKLWIGVDKTTISPGQQADEVNGFGGRYPALRFRNGSIVHFLASERRGISLASVTCDVMIIDEPTTERLFEEASRRVAMRGGRLIMGFTPINAPEPLDWLRVKVDQGLIAEHHARLTPEQLVPVGHDKPRTLPDGTPLDEAWIAKERALITSHSAAIVLDGDWETPPEDQAFPAFDPRVGGDHVSRDPPPADLVMDLYVGIDHGERDHKQCAVLVGLAMAGEYPEVWILDEWVGDGLTTPEEDARGILSMLARWGLRWSPRDLKAARGDKPHDVGGRFSMARKSNAELSVAIARRLNMAPDSLRPKIYQAKTGKGGGRRSVSRGARWLHTVMLRPGRFHIMERCERTRESLARWAWQDDEYKDLIDAVRYALWDATMKTRRITSGLPLRSP